MYGYNDELQKEMYLKELADAVHKYINSGIKTEQLDQLLLLENEFKEKYKKRFGIDKILNSLIIDEKGEFIKKIREINKVDEKSYAIKMNWNDKNDQILCLIVEKVNSKLDEVIKDTAYLSHINMLYELYERQEKLEKEKKEFEKLSKKYEDMARVTKALSEQKRMEMEEIEKVAHISRENLGNIFAACDNYFNFREKEQSVQVSLSPKGKKFQEYTLDNEDSYTSAYVNHLVYKNCSNILEAIENSKDYGMIYNLKLEGLTPEKERIIRQKYYQAIKNDTEMIDMDYFYSRRDLNEMKGVEWNEGNIYKLPDGWTE